MREIMLISEFWPFNRFVEILPSGQSRMGWRLGCEMVPLVVAESHGDESEVVYRNWLGGGAGSLG
jgi:hypothetical protein